VRNVILWFMVIVLPIIFPFIAFPLTQAIGRVWLKEFIRWLLYGLLVALFFFVTNSIFTKISSIGSSPSGTYENSTNIAFTLPNTSTGAGLGTGSASGIASPEAYSRYLTSLIMLWVSIILPLFLLHYGIKATEEAVVEWYNQGKLNPRLQSIIRALKPPSDKDNTATTGARVSPAVIPADTGAKASSPLTSLRTLLTGKNKEKVIAPTTTEEADTDKRTSIEPIDTALVQNIGIAQPATGTTSTTNETLFDTSRQLNLSPMPQAQTPATIVSPVIRPAIGEERVTTSGMSSGNLLRTAGLTELGTVAEEIREGRVQNTRLQQIARLETQPARLAQVVAQANMLSRPEQAPTEVQRNSIVAMKNNVLSRSLSNQTKGIIALARKDTGSVASQNITRELTERNLQVVREKTEKLLQTSQVTNPNTVRELEQLTQNIGKYQNTPFYKASEKNALGKQIEQAVRGLSQSKEAPKTTGTPSGMGTLPAPASAKVKQASELPATKEGDDLFRSMDVLNATEVAEGTVGKVEGLLAESEDIDKMVANQGDKNDFAKTKAHWVAYYRDTPVPTSDKISGRADWIKEQIKEQEPLLKDITEGDYEKRDKALNRLQKILPFLLLGNYSLLDITLYLKAKIAAARTVLEELEHPSAKNTQSTPEKNTQNAPSRPSYEENKAQAPSSTTDLPAINNNKAQ